MENPAHEVGDEAFFETGQGTMLTQERASSSFKTSALTRLLYGGEEGIAKRAKFRQAIDADPIFDNSDRIFLNRKNRYAHAMKKFQRVEKLIAEINPNMGEQDKIQLRIAASDDFPIALHFLMFMPNLKVLCTEEQLAKWLPPSQSYRIIGCYAQTELGHGSNVRGLETRATYIPETDEFEIHTPSLSALKWWPGSLGCTANHAIVFARLILQGRDYGVHNFIVPIRDMNTHNLLPGISAGDIGPKIGYNNMDNGWCRFNKVRVPRENMPMRFSEVSKDGKYVKKDTSAHDKVAYVTMMELRAIMISDCRDCLAKACTIAVRYSVVRRQGGRNKSGLENKILDYSTQQNRLLPLVATCFAFHFTGIRVKKVLEYLTQVVPKGQTGALTQVHSTLSGLKAFCTRVCTDGIEECRKCCGGHGYLTSSGLPDLLGFALQYVTAEGDEFVMAQQASRYLLKALSLAQQGNMQLLQGDCAYLQKALDHYNSTCTAATEKDMLQPSFWKAAHRHRAGTEYAVQLASKGNSAGAWNAVQIDQHKAVLAHSLATIVSDFVDSTTQPGNMPDPAIGAALQRACALFALYHMQVNVGDFLESGFFGKDHPVMLRSVIRSLLAALRPDAVALVDAFDISDRALMSSIGRRDGEAYKALFQRAQQGAHDGPWFDGLYEECILPLSKL